MKKLILILSVILAGNVANAQRYDVYIHDQAQANANIYGNIQTPTIPDFQKNFEEGRSLRKAWDEKKARKLHEKAMKELQTLNLQDKQAVLGFLQKYPTEIETVKQLLQISP